MKLKTLKDFEFKVDSDGNVCNLDDLRQKAIKWVRKWRSEPYDVKTHAYTLGKIYATMKLNNITEKDLEEKR